MRPNYKHNVILHRNNIVTIWHLHWPLTKNMEDSKELWAKGELMEAEDNTWFIFFLSLFQFHPSLVTNWNQVLTLRTNLVLRCSYTSRLSFICYAHFTLPPSFSYQYKHDNEHAPDMTLLDTINSTFFFFSQNSTISFYLLCILFLQ